MMIMIPWHSSLGFGFRFITAKGLPSFVQHSFRFHGLIQDTHVPQIHAGREFPDKFPTKYCFSKFNFLPTKQPNPTCGYFAVAGSVFGHLKHLYCCLYFFSLANITADCQRILSRKDLYV